MEKRQIKAKQFKGPPVKTLLQYIYMEYYTLVNNQESRCQNEQVLMIRMVSMKNNIQNSIFTLPHVKICKKYALEDTGKKQIKILTGNFKVVGLWITYSSFFFLFNSFKKIELTHHTIHPLKMYNSIDLRIFRNVPPSPQAIIEHCHHCQIQCHEDLNLCFLLCTSFSIYIQIFVFELICVCGISSGSNCIHLHVGIQL